MPPAAVPLAAYVPARGPDAVPPIPTSEPDERYTENRYSQDERYGAAHDGAGGYGDDGYTADGYSDGPGRAGGFAVLGFVILGVAALLGGAFFFAVLNSSPRAAQATASPTPTPAVSQPVTPTETAAESPSGSAGESAGATALPTEAPSVVPADFSAQVQPCATSDMDFHGCKKDGSTISGSQVWIWVGFQKARSSDVLGVAILNHADGSSVGDGSVELTNIGCTPDKPCTGYIQMTFTRLAAGDYDITVNLTGTQVATGAFTVSG